jgi:hypothetical protein
MHTAALTYPDDPDEDDKRRFFAFYRSLAHVLPCGGCRTGYAYLLAGPHPLTADVLAGRDALFKWTVDVHNAVNAKVGKPVRPDASAWFRHYDALRG